MYKSELQKFSRTKKSLNLPLNVMLVVLVTWLSEHGLSKDPKTMQTLLVIWNKKTQAWSNPALDT